MRTIKVSTTKPTDWPVPDPDEEPKDVTGTTPFGTYTLTPKGILTTEYADPKPVYMTAKRKYRGSGK